MMSLKGFNIKDQINNISTKKTVRCIGGGVVGGEEGWEMDLTTPRTPFFFLLMSVVRLCLF